jgi:hypothetical protein
MGATPNLALPYPEPADPADVPVDMAELANRLDDVTIARLLADAKGDLFVGTAADQVGRLAAGANGTLLFADSTQLAGVAWKPAGQPNGVASLDATGKVPGSQIASVSGELAYAEITSNVNVTATTQATANPIVTAPAVTFDGTTIALIDFYAPLVRSPAGGAATILVLFEDGAAIGTLAQVLGSTAQVDAPVRVTRRLTPAAGSRTYSVRAYVPSGTGIVYAGPGGPGVFVPVPAFIRIIRA